MLAMGGALDGVRIVSPESVKTFGAVEVRSPDALLTELMPEAGSELVCRTLGYQLNSAPPGQQLRFGPTATAFGEEGSKGQIGFCDPDHGISAGYIQNHLDPVGLFSTQLIHAVYRCAGLAVDRVPTG